MYYNYYMPSNEQYNFKKVNAKGFYLLLCFISIYNPCAITS